LIAITPTRWRPWSIEDVFRYVVAEMAALALIFTAWFEGSAELTVRHQLAWLGLGVVGLGLAGVANARWLLAARSAVGVTRVRLLPGGATHSSAERSEDGPLVVLHMPGSTQHHRGDCPMVLGKMASPRPAGSPTTPCEVCRP
jgi:hypothetical protein